MKFYVNKFFTYTIRKTSLLFKPILHEQENRCHWVKKLLLKEKNLIQGHFPFKVL